MDQRFAVQFPNVLWKTNNTGVFNFESFKPFTSTLSCSKGLQSLRRSTWSSTILGVDGSMVGEWVTDGKSGNHRWGRCQTIQKQQKFMHHLVRVCYISFRLVVTRWSFVEDEILGRSVYLSEVWKMSKTQDSRLLKVYFNMLGCKSKGKSGFAFFPTCFHGKYWGWFIFEDDWQVALLTAAEMTNRSRSHRTG